MAMPPITGPAPELNAQYQAALEYLEAQALTLLISTGAIIIGADSDASGTDGISLQTRGVTRLVVNNDGSFQSYGNEDWLIGESGAASATAGPAIKLATGAAAARYNWRTRTAPWTNGPGGETNYDDHVMILGFNSGSNGVAEVSGLVSFGLSLEHRFYETDHFQSEWIEYWNSADGSISRRPHQCNAHYNGRIKHTFNGDFTINRSNATGDPWLVMSEDNDFIQIHNGRYFRIETNNIDAIVQKNAAGTNVIPLIKLNGSDVVVIAGGGQDVSILGTATIGTASVGALNFGGNGDADTDIANIAAGYIQLRSNGTGKFYIEPSGVHMQAVVKFDNGDNIGETGSNRPGNIYVVTDVVAGGAFSGASLKLNGSTSGVITIQPAAVAGTYTLTLPTNDGTAGQVLQTDGSGILSWETPSGGSGIGGSTGSTDNAILRADGTGGSTAQSSGVIINDAGDISTSGGSVFAGGSATGDGSTAQGVFIGFNTTPRALFNNGTSLQNRAIDNNGGTLRFYNAQNGDLFMQLSGTALNLLSGSQFQIGGTKVLGAQGAAVADATDNASAITQLNALLARMRAHGAIAT